MPDDERTLTPEAIRHLLYRRDVAVTRHRAAIARSLGLADIEMLALVHLAEHAELAPSAIASLLDLSSGGATALVQRLERAGHVTRRPHPTDRRSVLIRLSPASTRRLHDAEAPLDRGLESAAAALSDDQRAAVAGVFAQLVALSEELEASMRRDAEPERDVPSRPVPSLWA